MDGESDAILGASLICTDGGVLTISDGLADGKTEGLLLRLTVGELLGCREGNAEGLQCESIAHYKRNVCYDESLKNGRKCIK